MSGTYKLEKADVGTGQNMKRKQASKGHSLPEEGRHRDWSGHRTKVSKWGATHQLERSEAGTCQDMGPGGK